MSDVAGEKSTCVSYVNYVDSILSEFRKVKNGATTTFNFETTPSGYQISVTNSARRLLNKISEKLWLDMDMGGDIELERFSQLLTGKFLDLYVRNEFTNNNIENAIKIILCVREIG